MLRVRYLLAFKNKSVWTIGPEEPVLEAIQMMADKHIGALPVVRGEELIGIVSERDYARKVILLGRSSSDTPVWQIMSSPVEDGVARRRRASLHGDHDRAAHPPPAGGGEAASSSGMISIGDLVKAVIEEQQQTIDQLERYIAG